MEFIFPETGRRISSSWTLEQIAEADQVVSRLNAEPHQEEDEDEKDQEDVKEKDTVDGSKTEDAENQK